jgi:PiT family inorganic phosphate transporter
MNQAIVGGIAGAGLARGVKYIKVKAIKEIVVNWGISLIVSGSVSFVLYTVLSWILGVK